MKVDRVELSGLGVRVMMWPYGYGAGWGWMIGGWIMMIVIWGLVIVGIVALVRAASNRAGGPEPKNKETPVEILRRRYAAGELTKEQFEEMKRDVA
jgi:putative membrane protein